MKSISKIYLFISFIVLLILLGSIFFFNQQRHKDKLQELRRYVVADFEKVLGYENANLLSFSLALSEDGALKEALYHKREKEAYQILFKIAERFKKNTHIEHLPLQIITNDFVIFAQNWKRESYGTPLLFRHDLENIKENRKPKVGIETGRRLTFKATIPIQYGKKYIGYLEVIKFIDELVSKLRQQKLELFVLMNPKHIVKNSLMKDFPHLKKYVIANKNYNRKLKEKVEEIDWQRLELAGYVEYKEQFFILKEMKNAEGTVIGKYLLVLSDKKFQEYQYHYQDISLLTRFSDEDVFNFVKREEDSLFGYHTSEEKELIEELIAMLPNLKPEEKFDTRLFLVSKLEKYKKSELIDIILHTNHKENKVGRVE